MNNILLNIGSVGFIGFHLSNLILDQSWTIFESDDNLFSLLTMNHHPVELDDEYCKEQQHGNF